MVAVPVLSSLQIRVLTRFFVVTGLDLPETDAIPAAVPVLVPGVADPALTHAIVMTAAMERTTTRQHAAVFVSTTSYVMMLSKTSCVEYCA